MKHLSRSLVVFTLLSGLSAIGQEFTPLSVEANGMTRIKPDQTIYNAGDLPNADNWEPYISVLGNSVFLIEANTFTTPLVQDPAGINAQRYGVTFQPAAGGTHVEGDAFYADDGTPYRGLISSRQNGNPGRVAGDKRPGAVNFITGGEAGPHAIPEFGSDGRWELGLNRPIEFPFSRYATVQTFSLNTSTLAQTPLSKAFDAVNGRMTSGDMPGGQAGRFGGEVACLDNGNFLVVSDDRSGLTLAGTAATAVIIKPDGTIVKDTFLIGPGELWSNVAAHKGGFCVRLAGMLKFYDNDGNFLAEADQAEATLRDDQGTVTFAFDRGRGDGTRIVSHINSPYVFLAGRNNESLQHVRVAVWDSVTRSLVAATNVSELTAEDGGGDAITFRPSWDRVGAAADALNRVTVAYEFRNAEIINLQSAARVLAFDGTSFRYLTPTFFAFMNHGATTSGEGASFRTTRPTVAMTTRQICIAAKGEVNSANDVNAGPNTRSQTTVYTVFSHPDPQPDPTPSANALRISGITSAGVITWTGGVPPFQLQRKTIWTGNWENVGAPQATRSATVPVTGTAAFFRIVGQ